MEGFRSSIDKPRFSKITRTCYYDRLGIATHATFAEPRTVMDQVKDLHALLEQIGLPGPYILIGSLGGANNLILFTDHIPPGCGRASRFVSPLYPTYYDHALSNKLDRLSPAPQRK